jgi:nucleotide-binding universal stress UspA family protein
MFHNILVAVDGSADADLALMHAIDLAGCGHSRLTLFTGIAQPSPAASWGLAASGTTGFVERAEAEAERIPWRARDRVPNDVSVAAVITRQPVKRALVRQIDAGHHDLVVVGSRGRGAIRSAVLGSVSHYVLHHSPVPVLIVHAESSRQDEPADLARGGDPDLAGDALERLAETTQLSGADFALGVGARCRGHGELR